MQSRKKKSRKEPKILLNWVVSELTMMERTGAGRFKKKKSLNAVQSLLI